MNDPERNQRPLDPRSPSLSGRLGAEFCPREWRRTYLIHAIALFVGAGVVAFATAVYFIKAEPAIRAFSATFDLGFTLFYMGMLLAGFSMVPMELMMLRLPRAVSPTSQGLELTYSGLAGARHLLTPWTKVVSADPLEGRDSQGRRDLQ